MPPRGRPKKSSVANTVKQDSDDEHSHADMVPDIPDEELYAPSTPITTDQLSTDQKFDLMMSAIQQLSQQIQTLVLNSHQAPSPSKHNPFGSAPLHFGTPAQVGTHATSMSCVNPFSALGKVALLHQAAPPNDDTMSVMTTDDPVGKMYYQNAWRNVYVGSQGGRFIMSGPNSTSKKYLNSITPKHLSTVIMNDGSKPYPATPK